MVNFLLKILITVIFSFLIIFYYYWSNPTHVEKFDGYLIYVLIVWIIYGIYKFFQISWKKEKVEFNLLSILGFFFLHLFILSFLYFYYNWLDLSGTFLLFLKIIFYLIFPIIIILFSISVWYKIIKQIWVYNTDSNFKIFNFLTSLWVWFFLFNFFLTIFWLFWLYNIYIVFLLLFWFLIYSFQELKEIYYWFLNYKVEFKNHNLKSNDLVEQISFKLLSTEFLFIVSTLIISINFISIIRPMPIGWDDLGVYMNYPRQMANSWTIDFLWWMYSWQVFTWIWFMIFEPIQAFFLNNIWWVLSFIVLILVFSDLLKSKKETLINIPLLLATVFISMPMVIFQQAKDMKLDEWLFFISVIVIYIVIKVFKKSESKTNIFNSILNKIKNKNISKWKEEKSLNSFLDNNSFLADNKVTLKLLFVIWLLAWFAFSIKVTSLLLISSIIWVLFYLELGFLGFIWYLSIFFSIFTKFNLWSYLNIVYDKNDLFLLNVFSIISFIIWLIFIILWFLRHKNDIKKLFLNIFIFIIWVLIALLPWFWKNIYQVQKTNTKINIWVLLWWKADTFKVDYNKIYSKEDLKKIEESYKNKWLTSSWITTNEDWGRYFWYEKWINNYVKLPWNLTMQVNQWWEFTNIWWLFLALIPSILLFFPYRKKWLEYFIVNFLLLEILLYIIPVSRNDITNIFASISLPEWYLYILLWFIAPLLFLLFWLKNNEKNNLLKINLIFLIFYIFLWTISAYWVVWYWIVMYFSMLLIIWIGLYYISSYGQKNNEKEKEVKLFCSIIVSIIFFIWIFLSVFPHGFNNLKNAWYSYIKSTNLSPKELVFAYHNNYLNILSTLNVDKKKYRNNIVDIIWNKTLSTLLWNNIIDIKKTDNFLKAIENWLLDKQLMSTMNSLEILKLKKDAKKTRLKIYDLVLNPDEKYKNKSWIYRIWTFLKYYISENNSRLYEDSLLTKFDKYFYNDNYDLWVSNMKKVWLKYLLVDLNAATIDNDPRHDLTRRYENLLKTFTSKKLKLIETDSICLKYALERYNKSKKTEKDLKEYVLFAWVNHESYLTNNKIISRGKKQLLCYKNLFNLIINNKVDKNNYSYLNFIKDEVLKNKKELKNEKVLYAYFRQRAPFWWLVLFEIK